MTPQDGHEAAMRRRAHNQEDARRVAVLDFRCAHLTEATRAEHQRLKAQALTDSDWIEHQDTLAYLRCQGLLHLEGCTPEFVFSLSAYIAVLDGAWPIDLPAFVEAWRQGDAALQAFLDAGRSPCSVGNKVLPPLHQAAGAAQLRRLPANQLA